MIRRSEKSEKGKQQELPLTVVFVRHGHADQQNISGGLGPTLSSLGRRQAMLVARRLINKSFDHIYSSDMPRAYCTAQAILGFHKDTPFTAASNIREVMHYHFTPGPTPRNRVINESIKIERTRIKKFAVQLRHAHKPGEKVLVVCHGNIIRSLISILGSRDPKRSIPININNTAVTILEVWPSGEAVLQLANCVKHLLPSQVT